MNYNHYDYGREGSSGGLIPPRWLHCPRKGSKLFLNKFLAFKTPLDKKYDDQVSMECRFHPGMLFDSMKSHKCEIGLWIDLTNTNRYYNETDVEERGCTYIKLPCKGHGKTPDRDQTSAFVNICKRYINQNPLKVIGIHCTHGFNRTGFLLIAYAVEALDWSLEAAIKEFSICRPPGIYKQDYLEELFRRYDDITDVMPAPERPSWCNEEEDVIEDDGYEQTGGVNRKRDRAKHNPVFMEGVGGVTPITQQPLLQEIQWKFQDFCHWDSNGFPGCQPVSMDKNNLRKLKNPYMVSWKADGTRYMMLIMGRDKIYFADRDHCIFQVHGLSFPRNIDLTKHLINTVLDGEMVIDKVIETNKYTGMQEEKLIPRYLIYDVITCDGKDVMNQNFKIRYDLIEKEVIAPRHKAIMKGMINRDDEPFGIRRKDFFDVHHAKSLLSDKFKQQLSHEPDGLIFQPVKLGYIAGRCDDVLKWKPASHNSVDFRLKIEITDGMGMLREKVGYLFVGGFNQPFDRMKVTKSIKDLNNKIIECRAARSDAGVWSWEFMRERTDKSFPNSYTTAKAVLESITNPVTTEMLLDFIRRYCPVQAVKRPHPQSSSSSSSSGSSRSTDNFAVPPPPKKFH